tara:strand:+ start:1083 stop:2165 length:1083 start_codon:yes stop_codon:yes gene_type:complete
MYSLLEIILYYFISGLVVNFLITKILLKYYKKLQLVDYPDQRKMHADSMPVVGGLGIFITILLGSFFVLTFSIPQALLNTQQIVTLYISTIIIVLTGLIDDIKGIGPFNKFLFQIIAALIFLIGFDLYFESIFGFNYSYFDFIVNIFFIVGITNAFNLLDGLDGLAGGVSLIICITLSVLSYLSGQSIHQLGILILLSGCLVSFLFFNKTPAKTFLGDTGSLFLGWIFSISSVYFFEKTTLSLSILLPLMILGLPTFDVIFVMLSRFTRRHRYNLSFINRFKYIFKPDNTHLHHLLLRGGLSKFNTVIFLYIITLLSCLICLIFWFNREEVNLLYGLIFILLLIFSLRFYHELKIKSRKK